MLVDLPAALPLPVNEPVLNYAPGSTERDALKHALDDQRSKVVELPHVIGGVERQVGERIAVREPHAHARVRGHLHDGGAPMAVEAIRAAKEAHHDWSRMAFEERARVFLRAADLLAGPWRATLNAATMLGQSKTAFQAEIDAACELIDFLRFNVAFASRMNEQPISPAGMRNVSELRGLEGFVFAVTPFNFTAIGANLPAAPALMGNTVVWKPAETQALAAHYTMKLFEAAGLPPGVINLVNGRGAPIADACLASEDLAGIHFTGSTAVFQHLWRQVGERIATYRTYPRIVGETGGKDFVFAHPSADPEALAVALVRGAFEFQGQKCSAASRAYVPKSVWKKMRDRVVDETKRLRMGDVTDFRNFMGAVIDERAFKRLAGWLDRINEDAKCSVLAGGSADDREGYFVQPTVVDIADPRHKLFQEELFGPVLAVYVYEDSAIDEVLELIDTTSPYALTGAIFARDRKAVAYAADKLRHAAGNLYINDKPTGAVVGQQPFGGARASGTNDKAGSALNLARWVSPRTVKETYVPPVHVGYPFMADA
jgi:1-pyrroline-5-carboxylate dehydrogenase